MAYKTLKLSRLPLNWKDQPQLFERYWDETMSKIEKSISDIQQLLIDVGIAQQTADGSLALAESAINPDGTIKPNKVTTNSVVPNGINKPYFVQTTSPLILPDGIDTQICSVSVTKDIADSDMEISSVVRLDSSDDLHGDFTIVRSGTVIDTLSIFNNGVGGTNRLPFPILFRDFTAPSGPLTYEVRFKRDGGGSTLRAITGTNLSVIEVKR